MIISRSMIITIAFHLRLCIIVKNGVVLWMWIVSAMLGMEDGLLGLLKPKLILYMVINIIQKKALLNGNLRWLFHILIKLFCLNSGVLIILWMRLERAVMCLRIKYKWIIPWFITGILCCLLVKLQGLAIISKQLVKIQVLGQVCLTHLVIIQDNNYENIW